MLGTVANQVALFVLVAPVGGGGALPPGSSLYLLCCVKVGLRKGQSEGGHRLHLSGCTAS